MKCPKCGYASFPYLDSCGKCGQGWAQQREAFGLYALRPDAPDLLVAYRETPVDADAMGVVSMQPAAENDLLSPERIELPLTDGGESILASGVVQDEPGSIVDLPPTKALEPSSAFGPLGLESDAEPHPPQPGPLPPTFDLSQLGDMALELEDAADLGSTAPDPGKMQKRPPEVRQVYDLDVDQDLGELALRPPVDELGANERGADVEEYILEIDDEVELELEIEELDIEVDHDAASEEEDDHER